MQFIDLIDKKAEGEELNAEEISFMIRSYTAGDIPDYQMASMCMAIRLKGMNARESADLTLAMMNSGDVVDLSDLPGVKLDKHSTGGVGDTTTLVIAPLVAACGGTVAKMSGRGLGHTGGTVDKLESITGYNTTLTNEEFLNQVENVGLAIIGQSGNLTPADKKLYALRDVTATVDSIPLITSSIMSKKLAAGSHNIVLDVKAGSGAFMKTLDDAEALAEQMVKIGKSCNRNIAAVITDMNSPLGNAIGNSLEVIEAVKVLKGEVKNDLYEVSVQLATLMLSLCFGWSEAEAEEKVISAIENGSAFSKMKEWIKAQGGDEKLLEDTSLFDEAEFAYEVKSDEAGYIDCFDTEKIGLVSVRLGAGREKKGDSIDYSAGIILKKKCSDYVSKGDTLAVFFTNNESSLKDAELLFKDSLIISSEKREKRPLIYKIIK